MTGCRYAFALGSSDAKTDITVAMKTPALPAIWMVGIQSLGGVGGVGGGFDATPTAAISVAPLWLQKLPPGPFAPAGQGALKPMVADYLAYLATLPGLMVSAPAPITVAGLSGQVATIAVGPLPPEAKTAACFVEMKQPCIVLNASTAGGEFLLEGDTAEIAVLDTPRGKLSVDWNASGTVDPALRAALMAAIRDITVK